MNCHAALCIVHIGSVLYIFVFFFRRTIHVNHAGTLVGLADKRHHYDDIRCGVDRAPMVCTTAFSCNGNSSGCQIE